MLRTVSIVPAKTVVLVIPRGRLREALAAEAEHVQYDRNSRAQFFARQRVVSGDDGVLG